MHTGGPSAPLAFILGVVLAYIWFFLQWPAWSLGLFCIPSMLVLSQKRRLSALLILLGLLSCSWVLQAQLDDRFSATEVLEIVGHISGLPEVNDSYTRFRFLPLKDGEGESALAQPDKFELHAVHQSLVKSSHEVPGQLLVYWYRDAPELLPGQVWRLQVQLKPPWGLVNFQGHDRERWLFGEGIGGQATVKQGELLSVRPSAHLAAWLDRARWRLAQDIGSVPSTADSLAMVAALAVADRSGVSKDQNRTLSLTGTSHLLAISGLHVGLAYLLAFSLARALLLPFGRWLQNSQRYSLLSGWLVALAYAALAGFSTATVRALIMLSVVLMLFLARRCIHPIHSWLLALAAVLLVDPLAPLKAGAWMSFVAVAALLLWFAPRRGQRSRYLQSTLQAQWAVMLFAFPFTAWWFQMSSPAGFVANLLAIPWVSLVVVPLVLLALLLWPLHGTAFNVVANAAAHATDAMMWVLTAMADYAEGYSSVLQPAWPSLALAIIAAGLLLLPRGLRVQAPALLLLVPLLLPAEPVSAGKLQLDVLDVGQGTALLLQTGSKLLLYDSGPGDGVDNDLVDSVIAPAVLATGHGVPDRIVISHGDLDHAGGMASLQERYPAIPMFASLRHAVTGIEPCNDTVAWTWHGSEFQVLHPSPYLPYRGNDSSCVLDINTGRFKILLTGDISSQVERRLLGRRLDVYRILLVPHHGSRSSSDPELLDATNPEWAFVTAGLGNRFGFPRPEVQQRYADAGIRLLSTDQCGALRLQIDEDGIPALESARRERDAPWRWPAGAACP